MNRFTANGYHMKMNRDVFKPMDDYNRQRRRIVRWETAEPDGWRIATSKLPHGIACSTSGAFHKRTDLKNALVGAYFVPQYYDLSRPRSEWEAHWGRDDMSGVG